MVMPLGPQKYGILAVTMSPCLTCQIIASTTPSTMLMERLIMYPGNVQRIPGDALWWRVCSRSAHSLLLQPES